MKNILAIFVLILLVGCSGNIDGEVVNNTSFEQNLEPAEEDIEDIQKCLECDDGDKCTNDVCSEKTGYKCEHEPLDACCGNNVWEKGETFVTCAEDVPECIQSNDICTTTEFNFDKGMCEAVTSFPCCGNGYCDIGETSAKCEDDCAPDARLRLVGYPRFFGSDIYIVIGEEATGDDSAAAANIMSYLLDNDKIATIVEEHNLIDVDEKELIVVGRPCDTELWEEFFGITECDPFDEYDGVIKVIENMGKKLIFVGANTPENSRKIVRILSEPEDFDLQNSEIKIKVSGNTLTLV
jgi:hypothetical protein